jgi:hypothetical protein
MGHQGSQLPIHDSPLTIDDSRFTILRFTIYDSRLPTHDNANHPKYSNMKRILFLVSFISIAICNYAQNKNLLSGKYSREQLSSILIPQSKWTPFPKITDRAGWEKADQGMMKAYLKEAEKYIEYSWPSIPATKSLLIERTGNRSEFEAISFEKRQVLGTLLLGEIYENKGRFIDPIINGVYSICEETWWGSPAHLPKNKNFSGLMDVSQPFVELFGRRLQPISPGLITILAKNWMLFLPRSGREFIRKSITEFLNR